jgi:carboxymethylenebutenolidase
MIATCVRIADVPIEPVWQRTNFLDNLGRMTNSNTTQLTAADGHTLDAYEVRPDGATAAVVVIQEIFGVNDHIRSVVDRYASFGYHAIAPALFDRTERGVELGYDEAGIAAGRALVGPILWEPAIKDTAAAIAQVAATGPVAIVGYCFGGSLAWVAANELPVTAAVGYYGAQIPNLLERAPKVPTLLHFGELDGGIPLDRVEAVGEAYPEVEIHVYPEAQHGFSCDARASYHPLSAAIALGRSLEFMIANGVRP